MMKTDFKIGDEVEFNPKSGTYAAQLGARARVYDINEYYLYVNWIPSELARGQSNGGYNFGDFI